MLVFSSSDSVFVASVVSNLRYELYFFVVESLLHACHFSLISFRLFFSDKVYVGEVVLFMSFIRSCLTTSLLTKIVTFILIVRVCSLYLSRKGIKNA